MMNSRDLTERPEQKAIKDTGLLLVVNRTLLGETHRFLGPYCHANVEGACFWFGVQEGSLQVVTTLALPEVRQTRGYYRVVPESLRRLVADMRAQGLKNLAQVHTHPSDWVGHSRYDDENSYSTKEGALSIVWPNYGASLHHDLNTLGIHERQGGEWVLLDENAAFRRIRLVDGEADYRWTISAGAHDANR